MKESNVSNLTRTLAVLSLLAPAGAYPLGIGEIKLHSALNQNLDAEISLMLSAGERISDIKVSLAPPDKFDERGVPWSYFLSNISFEPTVRTDGSAVIKVRSREALKEPILDLLLQVTWPKGTSYRHFSLMVDPPAAYAQPIVPITRVPETIAETSSESTPSAAEAPSYIPEHQSIASVASPVRHVRKDEIVKGVYGPTRRNDTLWGIAEKTRKPYKVSSEQMMVAIYKANPDAFYKQNMHALLARVKVKIPDREAVIKLSHQDAVAEFNRQTEAWKNHSQPISQDEAKVAESAQKETVPTEKPIENQLTLAAPAEALVAEKTVITPGQEQNAAIDSGKADAASVSAQANKDMQERMAAMEQQLAKMQALLTIKEQQLAALQNQAAQAPMTETVPTITSSQPTDQQHEALAVQQAQPASAAAAQAQLQPLEKATAGQAEKAAPAAQPQPMQSAPEPVTKPAPVEKPLSRSEPQSESIEEMLPSGLISGAGAVVLSLLGVLWWRKRKSKIEASVNTESMFSPSIIYKAPDSESNFSVPALNDSASYDINPASESSFLSEFTPSDFDAFDNDQGEIDPISEADVYLAYGRYQQAEELMRNAIESHPDRDECKLKLLEIYYASENKTGFEAYAKQLAAAGKSKNPVFWEKVIEMGREICPDLSLSSLEESLSASIADSPISNQSEPVTLTKQDMSRPDDFDMPFDTDFDLASFDSSFAGNIKPEQETGDSDFSDFDLSSGLTTDNEEVNDEQRNHADIDFNFDELPGQEAESDNALSYDDTSDHQFSAVKDDFDLESFNFDLGTSDAVGSVEDSRADLAIDQFDFMKESDDEKQENVFAGDFDFDFDFSTIEVGGSDDDRTDVSGVSDLTDMDELETKLDLARAYRDMGDNESAKDIVTEVLEKGSAEQKKVAQVLFDELI